MCCFEIAAQREIATHSLWIMIITGNELRSRKQYLNNQLGAAGKIKLRDQGSHQ